MLHCTWSWTSKQCWMFCLAAVVEFWWY